MTTAQIVLLVIVVAIVAAGVPLLIMRARSAKLRRRFGPEYYRTVAETGSRYRAENELQKIEKRVSHYPIRTLSSTECNRFVDAWRIVQAKFVDEPGMALNQADQLVGEVMSARGYPVEDFERSRANTGGRRHAARPSPGQS